MFWFCMLNENPKNIFSNLAYSMTQWPSLATLMVLVLGKIKQDCHSLFHDRPRLWCSDIERTRGIWNVFGYFILKIIVSQLFSLGILYSYNFLWSNHPWPVATSMVLVLGNNQTKQSQALMFGYWKDEGNI